jgi:tRNA pseudouridine55 synthase
MDGIIVVDKPEEWTSHDVVNRIRRLANMKKVGHLGTLDPLATGVLPVVLGKATRLSQFMMKGEKVYEGVVHFGYSTRSYDRAGEPSSAPVEVELDRARIEDLLCRFRGTFSQTPPPVSAKKVAGTPAYKLERKNIAVDLAPVEVTVHSLELTAWNPPEITLVVRCSAGTYLRGIAHDLGQALGCGAFLNSLRRTESSGFMLSHARTLEQLGELNEAGRLSEALLPAAELLPDFPSEYVDSLTMGFIRQGRDFRISAFLPNTGARYVKAISPDGELVAIGEIKLPNLYHPILVW